jgi:hypothetical protein
MSWVTKTLLCAERGYTDGQVKSRIQRGHWRQGIEWCWCDGGRLFDLDAIDARAAAAAETQRRPEPNSRRKVVRLA